MFFVFYFSKGTIDFYTTLTLVNFLKLRCGKNVILKINHLDLEKYMLWLNEPTLLIAYLLYLHVIRPAIMYCSMACVQKLGLLELQIAVQTFSLDAFSTINMTLCILLEGLIHFVNLLMDYTYLICSVKIDLEDYCRKISVSGSRNLKNIVRFLELLQKFIKKLFELEFWELLMNIPLFRMLKIEKNCPINWLNIFICRSFHIVFLNKKCIASRFVVI